MSKHLFTADKDNCGFGLLANINNEPSHKNLQDSITALKRMMHRGAVAADGKSGDGCGLLLSMPIKFMNKVAQKENISLPEQFAVAVVFSKNKEQLEKIEEQCTQNDLKVTFIREVPVSTDALGDEALKSLPSIHHIFVTPDSVVSSKRFDAMLYLTRKELEDHFRDDKVFYIPSFSSKTIIYKGLVMPTHIQTLFSDLQDEDFEISFSLFHQRFSTNTLPKWKIAQPFRTLAHNGEINSIRANRHNVAIKFFASKSKVFTKNELKRLSNIIEKDMSDSASLDNFFEFLLVNDVDFLKATRSIIPAPWQNAPHMDSKLRAFYEYTSSSYEAWDGPAAVSITDGRHIGCVLDRNGLRPAKYIITKDGMLVISSEYGVVDIDEDNIKERGRLKSGEMIALDLKNSAILKNKDINDYIKESNQYSKWLNEKTEYLQEYIEDSFYDFTDYDIDDIEAKQRYFNITLEAVKNIITPMAKDGKEPIGSMGDDTPLVAFSNIQRNFTDFFKQKFAQVTNPPIDPYRETVVMSLNTGFGGSKNILEESVERTYRLKSVSPILMKEKFDALISFGNEKNPRYKEYYKNASFSTAYSGNLEKALKILANTVTKKVIKDSIKVIILDDSDISKESKTIPMVMAIGKVLAELYQNHKKSVSVVAKTGDVYDPHSASVLIAFGATAIYPYMLYATICNNFAHMEKNAISSLLKNSQKALNAGILKIMSKMGISTVSSYRNSSLHDVIGLSTQICKECFPNADSMISGLEYEDIDKKIDKYHKIAFNGKNRVFPLNIGTSFVSGNTGEYHDFRSEVVKSLQQASRSGSVQDYDIFKAIIDKRDKKMIRDYFYLKSDKAPIDISKVESKKEIYKRLGTAAMSCGSISIEAHEALAEAMNRLGGQSNSGEGGEDKNRFNTLKNSKIKQVASGRFGVTPGYLASATEIQIKVAQGAKPGEGGQLPGHKVTPMIATLRHTIPGSTLISPPPHHDIYSIEDLAQLIFDLKQINTTARISVKLVSTVGVGTIATGVAKAYADKIIISGADGGTGAAPLSSIKHTGNPWELGLSEAHNALKANSLRKFVTLETDGGLKTGLDIVKAAMLGAESFTFGTGALVTLGCIFLRACHTNKCTVGVATQNELLREHFLGTVKKIMNYFELMADDVQKILASLGYQRLEDIIGRSDLLKVIDDEFAKKFDFDFVLAQVDGDNTCKEKSNDPFDKHTFENKILKDIHKTIENPANKIVVQETICNLNRSFGTRISGEIAKYYGDAGLNDNAIAINLDGVAGQSLGAFLIKGVSIKLSGYANDYVGKGMHGGEIIISPKNQQIGFGVIGNTCLYGATGGKLFASGTAGERFGVRNSGAISVVEGVGDHACEYMTGGVVAIIGECGINFGAGMTGGVAFVYDKDKDFVDKLNRELVEMIRIDTDDTDRERHYLKKLLTDYQNKTGSKYAQKIINNYREEIRYFWMVQPKNTDNHIALLLQEEDKD
jgi:glutamate synthase (NADPH/NADH) large chain